MAPAPTPTTAPMSPERPNVEEELGRGKRLKVPSWKVRRNLDQEFENPIENPVGNPVENDPPVENDEDFDTEEEGVVRCHNERQKDPDEVE